MVFKNCLTCNKKFLARERTDRPSIYYSRKCYDLSQIHRIKLICPTCNKEFERIPSRKPKYCSPKCNKSRLIDLSSGYKKCAKCHLLLSLDNFYVHKETKKYFSYCKNVCIN